MDTDQSQLTVQQKLAYYGTHGVIMQHMSEVIMQHLVVIMQHMGVITQHIANITTS